MKRKIVSLLVACTCILGLVGPASAASIDSNGESVIMPRDTLFQMVSVIERRFDLHHFSPWRRFSPF